MYHLKAKVTLTRSLKMSAYQHAEAAKQEAAANLVKAHIFHKQQFSVGSTLEVARAHGTPMPKLPSALRRDACLVMFLPACSYSSSSSVMVTLENTIQHVKRVLPC